MPLPPLDRFAGIDRANAERLKIPDTVIGFKAVWFSEWQQDLITSLNDMLTSKVTPNQWVTDRRTKWDTLQKQYSK